MINKLKQHKLILIIFIIGIILIVTGTTYSFYKIKLEGQKQHIVSSDVISFTYKESEDKIAITNMNPISDTQGKKNNYFEFKAQFPSQPGRRLSIRLFCSFCNLYS